MLCKPTSSQSQTLARTPMASTSKLKGKERATTDDLSDNEVVAEDDGKSRRSSLGEEPHRCQPTDNASKELQLTATLQKYLSYYFPTTTLTLENSGSVARDHLASERTFLAYVRTSLAISSAGVGAC